MTRSSAEWSQRERTSRARAEIWRLVGEVAIIERGRIVLSLAAAERIVELLTEASERGEA